MLRVTDWHKHFENNRTRELKRLEWVPMPTKQDGDGYTELLDHPDGAAHFGCWCAIVEVAAKCQPRGVLARAPVPIPQEGATPSQASAGRVQRAHDPDSLARMTGIKAEILAIAISRLLHIGWLETFEPEPASAKGLIETSHFPASESQDDASSRARAYGTERNGTEHDAGADVGADAGEGVVTDRTPAAINRMEWEGFDWGSIIDDCKEMRAQFRSDHGLSPNDREEIIKVQALAKAGILDRESIEKAIRYSRGRRIKKPFAAFHGALSKVCDESGLSLNRLFRAVSVPEWLRKPSTRDGQETQ